MIAAPELEDAEIQKRYFISLGAGRNQVPLIEAARKLGLNVIAVDRDLRAPGFEHADIHLQCSIFRPRKIMQMLSENLTQGQITGVACRSFGSANLSAAIISHSYGTPGLAPRTVKLFRNKRVLKERLAVAGVATPRSFSWKTYYDKLGFKMAGVPLVVRPVNGHGKIGLEVLETREDILAFLEEHPEDNGSFLAEEYIPGDEVTVLGLVRAGRFELFCLTDKIVSDSAPRFAEKLHRYPSLISETNKERITQAMQKIVDFTGIKTAPIVAEFIVGRGTQDTDDRAYLVECAPEIGGEYLADFVVPAARNTSFFQEVIALSSRSSLHPAPLKFEQPVLRRARKFSWLPEKESLAVAEEPREETVLIRFLTQQTGRLKYFRFPEALKDHPGFLFAHQFKKPGDQTAAARGNLDRIAVFGLKGPLENRLELESDLDEIATQTIIEYE